MLCLPEDAMAARKSAPPTAEQRSATSKRARTRALVLRTALECIEAEGLGDATAAKIAQRCGLSWGVIQYHFGDRAGLFMALFEQGFESLARALSELEAHSTDLPDRLAALVEGTWSLMERPGYRALLEVQLHLHRDSSHAPSIQLRGREMRRQLRELWRKTLPEYAPTRVDRAERLATVSLRGMALERATGGTRRTHAGERKALVEALGALLRDSSP
jgi:AcrR family transcriptional regulator